MCARFTLTSTSSEVARLLGLEDLPDFEPRVNIAPSEDALVEVLEDGRPQLRSMRWGLIPSWADDPQIGQRLINARSETVAERPAFRAAFRQRRCLIPASGFFEWLHLAPEPAQAGLFGDEPKPKAGKVRKVPFYFSLRNGEPFCFAGVWERWNDPAGEPVHTFSILTTEPNELVRPMHNRMPVILPPEVHGLWLEVGEDEVERLLPLLVPFEAEAMQTHPVTSRLNDPRFKAPDCLQPVSVEGVQ
jgi:putative SOS response-associated peptidase YedK